jgi:5-formyltetrahydrofolate cyclo-ligase
LEVELISPLSENSLPPSDRHLALRKRIRKQRKALPEQERRVAEQDAARNLLKLGAVLHAQRIATYLSVDGELDLEMAIIDSRVRRALIYAPVIEKNTLRFAPLRDDTDLRDNALGIPEPITNTYIAPRHLDIVLTPLVAFDNDGTRIGMGGGYYDRCFKFLASCSSWLKPKLIGIGYEFQRVHDLERQSWDIPLWAAVTDRGIYRF